MLGRVLVIVLLLCEHLRPIATARGYPDDALDVNAACHDVLGSMRPTGTTPATCTTVVVSAAAMIGPKLYAALLWAMWRIPDHVAQESWGVEQLIVNDPWR